MASWSNVDEIEIKKLRARVAELERERDEVRTQRDTAERRRKTLLEEWRQETEIWLVTVAERDAALARVVELEAALGDAVDVAIWMSGSTDFSPGGIAHEGWEKARPKLHAAMRALSSPPPHDGEGKP